MIVALFLAVPYWKARYLDRPASKGGATMLEIINLRKTFNPGTVNEKTALDGVFPHPERRRLRQRDRRKRRGQIHAAQRRRGHLLVDSGTIFHRRE